jgi:hypothetical protein
MGSDSRECADCGKAPPHTETAYTLISPKHAWRLSRRAMPDGTVVVEWRCPECWRKYKDSMGSGALSSSKFLATSVTGESSSRIRIEPPPSSSDAPPGNGTAGNGTAGNGTAGNGTAGNGSAAGGSGTRRS